MAFKAHCGFQSTHTLTARSFHKPFGSGAIIPRIEQGRRKRVFRGARSATGFVTQTPPPTGSESGTRQVDSTINTRLHSKPAAQRWQLPEPIQPAETEL